MRLSCVTIRLVVPCSSGHRLQKRDHVPAALFVEGGGRLVGQDQPRPIRQGPGDRHPLPLAAGELVRLVEDAVAQAEVREQVADAGVGLGRRVILKLHRHADVLIRRQRVEQIVGLEDEADAAAELNHPGRPEAVQLAAQDP